MPCNFLIFIFFYSYNTFFINCTLKFKYQPGHLKDDTAGSLPAIWIGVHQEFCDTVAEGVVFERKKYT